MLPSPVIMTDSAGSVETRTLKPTVAWVSVYITSTATQVITKSPPSMTLTNPNDTEIPQVPAVTQHASSRRKLGGGAVGGIVGGGIIAVVILLSAVIFTWRRLYARGNFDLPTGFGGATFGGHQRRRGSGRGDAVDDGVIMSGTYDPHSSRRAAQRQQMLQDVKFGRSTSGSSGGGGYRGATTLGGTNWNRGSEPFCPSGTTMVASDGDDKLANSQPVVSVHPVTPPAGATPPVYYEADGAPLPLPPGSYAVMNQDAYPVEIADGEPLPLPVQRWQVTNPDLESVSSRAPSRVGQGRGDLVQVHTGTNF